MGEGVLAKIKKKCAVDCNKYNVLNGPKIGPTKPNFK